MVGWMETIGILIALFAALYFARLAWKLGLGSGTEYNRNRSRLDGFGATLRGQAATSVNGSRDYRVAAGIAIDTKANRWVEQGRLSDEAVLSSIRRTE